MGAIEKKAFSRAIEENDAVFLSQSWPSLFLF